MTVNTVLHSIYGKHTNKQTPHISSCTSIFNCSWISETADSAKCGQHYYFMLNKQTCIMICQSQKNPAIYLDKFLTELMWLQLQTSNFIMATKATTCIYISNCWSCTHMYMYMCMYMWSHGTHNIPAVKTAESTKLIITPQIQSAPISEQQYAHTSKQRYYSCGYTK